MGRKKEERLVKITTFTNGKMSSRLVPVKGDSFLEAWAGAHPSLKKRKRT